MVSDTPVVMELTPADSLREVAASAVRLMALLPGESPRGGGSLTVVGTGIRAMPQLTVEALAAMASADVLLHVIGEPEQEAALKAINPNAQTLTGYYLDGLERSVTYEAMVRHILAAVMEGRRTVAAFYGHPGVYTYPSHEAVRRTRSAGYPARMLAGVSSEDCLIADLGIDPGDGCNSYEATDFLFFDRRIDPMAHLLLWQVGSIGNWTYESAGYNLSALPSLVAKLLRAFPPDHPVTLYEAPFSAGVRPRVEVFPLIRLSGASVTPATTLHIGPRVLRV